MEALTAVAEVLGFTGLLALWALVVIYLYKAIIVGTIYGVARYFITKVHDICVAPRTVQLKVGTTSIDQATAEALIAQLARLGDKGYIHMEGVQKLRQALDDKGL